MAIVYRTGDATQPELDGKLGLLIHVCNDRNGFGRGFVSALTRRWPQPKQAYHQWFRDRVSRSGEPFTLGSIQCVQVERDLHVVNMIAQEGYTKKNEPALRYQALAQCLSKVAELAKAIDATIHMPRIGIGLGGGSWEFIEPLVSRELSGLSVTVYDYP